MYYADAIEAILKNDFDSCLEAVVRKEGHVIANVGSWVSLVRLIAYEIRSEAPAADRSNALAELADWHLLSAPVFSPEVPVTLPTYEPNPFASAAVGTSRHIDVSFDVTKYGRAERIEVLASSKGATRGEERDLMHLIGSTSFRPRMVNGALADEAPVTVCYYLQ